MQRLNFNFRLIRRLVWRYSLVWVADAVSIALTAFLMPGIYVVREGPYWYLTPFAVALGLGLLNALLRPVLLLLLLPITFVTLGLATLALNAGLFYLIHLIISSFEVETFGAAVLGVFILTLINTLLGNLIHLGDDYSFYATMMNAVSTMTRPKAAALDERGLVILQIDGLAYSSLKRALRRGKMPFLSDMLKRQKYDLRKWYSGLPSQTSAVQAGIFYGTSYDIPGFRWYSKETGRVVTSSNAADMSALDSRIAPEADPLLSEGTCINALIHGGAHKRILVVSAMSDKDLKHHRGSLEDFAIFSLHPYLYTRMILLMAWDFAVDRVENLIDFIRRKKPRLSRSVKFSFLRAVANSGFREVSTYFIMEDIVRGIPVIYANYLGYDMVAHYAGPNSWDALSTLSGIDRQIKRIARMIERKASKHYDLVVLSDHGQSQSVPFERIYGRSLPQIIEDKLDRKLTSAATHTAELGYFDTLLRELRTADEAYGTRNIRSSRRTLERLQSRMQSDKSQDVRETDGVVVCASGNLAHVYFADIPGRATTAQILARYPDLLESLVAHPGIGFVITTSDDGEFLAMGKGGMRRLRASEVEGSDPLDSYGDASKVRRLAGTLVELCGYPNSGDLVVNGAQLGAGVVVTFEPQRGTHGGVGGDQTDPFVVYPRRFRTRQERSFDPRDMHGFLRRLLAAARLHPV